MDQSLACLVSRLHLAVCLSLAVFALLTAPIDAAQTVANSGTPQRAKDKASPDIVVEGVLDGHYPIRVQNNLGSGFDTVTSRQAASDAKFFSQCVKGDDNKALQELIDGQPNREGRAAALDWIIRGHKACYPGYTEHFSMINVHSYGDCNPRVSIAQPQASPICQSMYDRGALIEKVLATYAADIQINTDDLFRSEVIARFKRREDKFDRTRSRQERVYVKVVSCLVARNPSVALAYERSPAGSENETKLGRSLIGTASECVGRAQQVRVDPSQFRIYLGDAIYSWILALRGVDSPVPVR